MPWSLHFEQEPWLELKDVVFNAIAPPRAGLEMGIQGGFVLRRSRTWNSGDAEGLCGADLPTDLPHHPATACLHACLPIPPKHTHTHTHTLPHTQVCPHPHSQPTPHPDRTPTRTRAEMHLRVSKRLHLNGMVLGRLTTPPYTALSISGFLYGIPAQFVQTPHSNQHHVPMNTPDKHGEANDTCGTQT